MKRSRIEIWLLLAFLFPGLTLANVEQDKEIIQVRKIGHEFLKYLGDSTSSLKPVITLKEHAYRLEFHSEFEFLSDSLIEIVNSHLEIEQAKPYFVKVFSCDQENLVFSYFMALEEEQDLLSCSGRKHPKSCYHVDITFVENANENGFELLLLFLALPLLGVFLYFQFKSPSPPSEELEYIEKGKTIGAYTFDFSGQQLLFAGQVTPLTYKESKILRVLSNQINEVVERDELQKQVWEEDGIVVGRSLDMFISKLRKKLNQDNNVQIKNIHGIGYKLMVV